MGGSIKNSLSRDIPSQIDGYGTAVPYDDPRRPDLLDRLKGIRGLPLVSMDELIAKASYLSGPMDPVRQKERIVTVAEWRDGSVLDVVRQVE
jgi:citrate lyase subunit alpha/citrate CoA-transferase